jgi:cytochrome oxidase Cu insertion factor (SCO1/SenC/PrrC family)
LPAARRLSPPGADSAMDNSSPKAPKSVWIGLVLVVATLGLIFALARIESSGKQAGPLPVLGQLPDFVLTNQSGQAVTLADLRGKVWIADIIFTRCAGPCPHMTRRMKILQSALPATSPAKLVTLTTDPDFDTPPVMKAYGEKFGADAARWIFLTGRKTEIARLAIDGLKLTTVEKKPEERADPADLFIHSTIFVIVDKQARLRGVFETVGEDLIFEQVKPQILAAIEQLEREP